MKHSQQVGVLKELMAQIDEGRTVDAGRVLVAPTSAYTSEPLARREWETFFATHPQLVGLSGDLPQPGTFLTANDFGTPILATRDAEGRFRAFVNACRHRGAQLTDEERGERRRFTCPFHAWTYDNTGRLLGIKAPDQFGAVDKRCSGLVELPAAERYGMLFVHPQIGGTLDVDALLGAELAAELGTWELARCGYMGVSVLDMPLNWKIANDTFGEVYHFNSLHKDTVNNLFHSDHATYTEFGRNHRICVANRYIDAMRSMPESSWSLTDGGITAYYLFPNVQIVIFNRVVALIRIYPDPGNLRRSISRVSHFSASHMAEHVEDASTVDELSGEDLYRADMSARVEFNLGTQLELFLSTVEQEDYAMGVKTQATADSGKLEHFLFGRNEPALHHFHNNYRAALDMPPLEEYRAG